MKKSDNILYTELSKKCITAKVDTPTEDNQKTLEVCAHESFIAGFRLGIKVGKASDTSDSK